VLAIQLLASRQVIGQPRGWLPSHASTRKPAITRKLQFVACSLSHIISSHVGMDAFCSAGTVAILGRDTKMTSIPLVDLAAQHNAIAGEVSQGWQEVLAETAFIGGRQVREFEHEFAEFVGARHCVGVANGTDAIEIALRALGIGPGDECILPANTFIATAEAVYRAGARPVLVDCTDDGSYLIDTDAAESAVTSRTRAIIPVHLYGQTAAVERLAPIVARHGISIVEDAAQAQGARRHGVRAGVLGDVAATSFYPGKNLGAYGDAGAILTSSDELAARMRQLSDHGSMVKYRHDVIGFNSRLDTLQAVVLSVKLRRLDDWNAARRIAAARYDDMLANVDGVILPRTLPGNEHVWHLYVIQVSDRDRILKELHAAGIGAAMHYPVPVHLAPATVDLGYPGGAFPVAERIASQLISLPIFAEITQGQQEAVAAALQAALQ
jgi:dTDP-4-amino-4,6-dideoxygalactose transaminase